MPQGKSFTINFSKFVHCKLVCFSVCKWILLMFRIQWATSNEEILLLKKPFESDKFLNKMDNFSNFY